MRESEENAVTAKLRDISELSDQKWHTLAQARGAFVDGEKRQVAGWMHSDELCAVIDEGYLKFLDCILHLARK